MLLSRRNQLLLEFSFWNEPLPRQGPNIYELRTYKLKVSPPLWGLGAWCWLCGARGGFRGCLGSGRSPCGFFLPFQPGTMIEWGNNW